MAEESVDILEFIGFMPDTARIMYQRYCDCPTDLSAGFMDFLRGHLNSLGLPQYKRLSYHEALRHVDLNLQTQDDLLDPRFEHIFRTQTLSYWAKDTVLAHYTTLLARNDCWSTKIRKNERNMSLPYLPNEIFHNNPLRQQRLTSHPGPLAFRKRM